MKRLKQVIAFLVLLISAGAITYITHPSIPSSPEYAAITSMLFVIIVGSMFVFAWSFD